jgi:hypothetical protein
MPTLLKTLLLAFVLLAPQWLRWSVAQPRFAHPAWEGPAQKARQRERPCGLPRFYPGQPALNGYLSQLAANPPQRNTGSRDEQLAYWLNAYNAYTVQLIARHYPLKSINDIKRAGPSRPGTFRSSPSTEPALPSTTSSTKSCASNCRPAGALCHCVRLAVLPQTGHRGV